MIFRFHNCYIVRKIFTLIIFSFALFTLFFFTSIPTYAGWLIYHKPEFKGKVIDSETKGPIEGSVVVAIYKKHPIISGPAGGSASIVEIKETLTNEKGEFFFPPYTTFIQPLAKEWRTDFIIYKPGYGCYPGLQVKPPKFLDPEKFFSGELGTKEEIQQGSKVMLVESGIVEIPPLKTKSERLNATPGTPSQITSEELPLLFNAINSERKRFGLGEVK